MVCRNLSGCVEPLVPPRSRLRSWFPADTPLVTSALSQPLLCAELQLSLHLWAWLLAVNEVAESTSRTSFTRVQSATRFAEVGDGTELAVDGSTGVPATVDIVARGLGAVFVFETRVDIADQICH